MIVNKELSMFLGTFTTLLAIINPLESLPVFLGLLAGKDEKTRRSVAARSCLYATGLMFFFLFFGTLLLRLFGVPLSMVRMVGGIVLMKIGFDLFSPTPSSNMIPTASSSDSKDDFAFVPLAMPLMFGPGAIATVIGMSALIKDGSNTVLSFFAISAAIIATMLVTYLVLAFSDTVTRFIGPKGIDATTRIVGFFVAAMGMGLIFNGLVEVLRGYGLLLHS